MPDSVIHNAYNLWNTVYKEIVSCPLRLLFAPLAYMKSLAVTQIIQFWLLSQ